MQPETFDSRPAPVKQFAEPSFPRCRRRIVSIAAKSFFPEMNVNSGSFSENNINSEKTKKQYPGTLQLPRQKDSFHSFSSMGKMPASAFFSVSATPFHHSSDREGTACLLICIIGKQEKHNARDKTHKAFAHARGSAQGPLPHLLRMRPQPISLPLPVGLPDEGRLR